MSDAPEGLRVLALDTDEILALKALYDGNANEYQQRQALTVIVNKFSRAQDVLFIPGAADQTAFLNGRAFVGMQILKYLKVPIGKLEPLETTQ